jgi:hypothetical protein
VVPANDRSWPGRNGSDGVRKDGPVQAYFLKRVVPEFLPVGSTAPAMSCALSAARCLPLDKRMRCAAILGLRLWEFSEFSKLRGGRPPRRVVEQRKRLR